jgi:hypothetical protein
MRQSELAQTMRAHVDEQIKNLQNQTIQRKSQESALFCSQAKALKIRAQAKASEDRVQRLANELKRVYHSLPETIQKKSDGQMDFQGEQLRESELTALRLEHNSEFCKYLDSNAIQDETKTCINRSIEIEEFIESARNVLVNGQILAEAEVQQAKLAETAINALHDRWSRFIAAGHPAGQLTVHNGTGEDADCILQRSLLTVKSIVELLQILSKDQIRKREHEKPAARARSESRDSTVSDLNMSNLSHL